MTIGYTAGVFDLFHIGHLNLLKNAKGMCDKLIVGVTTDDLVTYKGKHAMIPYEDRAEIVRNIRFVDAVVPQSDMDKLSMCKSWGPRCYLWATIGMAPQMGGLREGIPGRRDKDCIFPVYQRCFVDADKQGSGAGSRQPPYSYQ